MKAQKATNVWHNPEGVEILDFIGIYYKNLLFIPSVINLSNPQFIYFYPDLFC